MSPFGIVLAEEREGGAGALDLSIEPVVAGADQPDVLGVDDAVLDPFRVVARLERRDRLVHRSERARFPIVLQWRRTSTSADEAGRGREQNDGGSAAGVRG